MFVGPCARIHLQDSVAAMQLLATDWSVSVALQNGAETAATAVPQSEYLLLRSGANLPLVGFGTYKVDKADSVRYAAFLFHAT